jgi:predicted acetylornithine/succinylornithine family transaminase
LIHVSNLYHIEPQIDLAEKLVGNSFADKVFFCNSGAEANEAAIKLARKHFADQRPNLTPRIITAFNSFHGRTLANLAATGQEVYRKGFEPITPGFSHVPFNDLQALEEALGPDVAAIMLEPIQGEGGVNMPDENYLKEVRSICDQNHIVLILDEVQTGMGRTGRLFAHEHWRIFPDIMTLAKGVAGGAPMGAMLALDEVASVFGPGSHAATFGGNPLCAAAGLTVMERILAPGFLESVKDKGELIAQRLDRLMGQYEFIRDSRGLGLMRAIELDDTEKGPKLVESMKEEGVLVNCAAGKVIRFLPPLVVENEEIEQAMEALDRSLKALERN